MENCLPKDNASELQLNIRTVERILKTYREAWQMSAKKNSVRPPMSTEKSRSTLRSLAVVCPQMTSKQRKQTGVMATNTLILKLEENYANICNYSSNKSNVFNMTLIQKTKTRQELSTRVYSRSANATINKNNLETT